jgi:hypothetical protein
VLKALLVHLYNVAYGSETSLAQPALWQLKEQPHILFD